MFTEKSESVLYVAVELNSLSMLNYFSRWQIATYAAILITSRKRCKMTT